MPSSPNINNAEAILPVAYSAKNSKGYFVRAVCLDSSCFVELKDPVTMAEKAKTKGKKAKESF
jgi:hypothetical protein